MVGKFMATKRNKEYIPLQKLGTKAYSGNTTRRLRMEHNNEYVFTNTTPTPFKNLHSKWGLLVFLLLDSSIWVRRSTDCLHTPIFFPLRHRIACTLPTHHELIYSFLYVSNNSSFNVNR
jgi:hypothetical protein